MALARIKSICSGVMFGSTRLSNVALCVLIISVCVTFWFLIQAQSQMRDKIVEMEAKVRVSKTQVDDQIMQHLLTYHSRFHLHARPAAAVVAGGEAVGASSAEVGAQDSDGESPSFARIRSEQENSDPTSSAAAAAAAVPGRFASTIRPEALGLTQESSLPPPQRVLPFPVPPPSRPAASSSVPQPTPSMSQMHMPSTTVMPAELVVEEANRHLHHIMLSLHGGHHLPGQQSFKTHNNNLQGPHIEELVDEETTEHVTIGETQAVSVQSPVQEIRVAVDHVVTDVKQDDETLDHSPLPDDIRLDGLETEHVPDASSPASQSLPFTATEGVAPLVQASAPDAAKTGGSGVGTAAAAAPPVASLPEVRASPAAGVVSFGGSSSNNTNDDDDDGAGEAASVLVFHDSKTVKSTREGGSFPPLAKVRGYPGTLGKRKARSTTITSVAAAAAPSAKASSHDDLSPHRAAARAFQLSPD